MTVKEVSIHERRARELAGEYWVNGDPVSILNSDASAILLVFWHLAGRGSVQYMPYVSEWSVKYAAFGLHVIGVHSPRYEFERDVDALRRAVASMILPFPVVADLEGVIAAHYDIRVLPSLVLVDRQGYIRAQSYGEGSYQSVERIIQNLLHEGSARGELPPLMDPLHDGDREGVICYQATPELEAGYIRGSLGNVEGCVPLSVMHYEDPGLYLDGRVYVKGEWLSDREAFRLEPENGGEIILDYRGMDVYGVFEPAGQAGIAVEVVQDGESLTEENRGADVHVDEKGHSVMVVRRAGLYSIVRNKTFDGHLLRLIIAPGAFALYGFSFSTTALPEFISTN